MEAAARRGMALLLLHAVLGAGLFTVRHASGIERSAYNLVANAREIFHATTTHEHNGVLLQVVTLARDVDRDLDPAGKAHAGDLPQCGVRFFRGRRVNASANATALRGSNLLLGTLPGLEARGCELTRLVCAALADELARSRHVCERLAASGARGRAPQIAAARCARLELKRSAGPDQRRAAE